MCHFSRVTKYLLFLVIASISISAACTTLKDNSNINTSILSASPTSSSTGASGGNRSQATPTPGGGVPDFKVGEDYKTVVRVKMLKDGWAPAPTEDADPCGSGDSSCDEFPEMENCAGTGAGNCKFLWKRGDKTLAIFTVGRPHEYSDQELESAPKSVKSDLTGNYLYSTKHDSGVDTFLIELRSGNRAAYKISMEGGGPGDKTGTWSEKGDTVTLILRSPDSGDKEVYVFVRSGKDLKMTDEPKNVEGYVGFVGKIFKKQ